MLPILAQAAPALDPHQVVAFVLVNIAIILVVARLCGIAARRIGQPAVVGEIIAGILLGPTLLGPTLLGWGSPPAFLNCGAALAGTDLQPSVTTCLFPPQSRAVLGVLGQVALLLFMFMVGLELNPSQLKGKAKPIAVVAFGVVAIPVAVGFLLQPVLFNETFIGDAAPPALAFNIFVGALISVTAFPVMVRILQEKGLTTTQMGAVGIAAAAVVTVLMFVLVAVAGAIGRGAATGEVVRQLVLITVYIGAMLFVVRPLLSPLGRRYESAARRRGVLDEHGKWSQMDEYAPAGVGWVLTHHMFAVVIVVVLLSGWVAHILGLNVIVGGFLAGVAMPAREGLMRDVAAELFDLTAIVLLPIFLAFSGLNTDFTTLTVASLGGLAVFIVASVVAKWPAGAALARASGLSWAEGNVLGVLLNCRGLLPLVVALIGIQTGVISPVMQVGAVLMALVTTVMTGPLFDRFIGSVTRPTAREPETSAG